jgi:hypothetical protein
MKAGSSDEFTEFGTTISGRCSACASVDSDFFVYPVDLVTRVLCLECVRGAVMAAARETKRRDSMKPII